MAFTAAERAKIAHYMGWPAYQGTTLDTAILNVEADVERTILVRAEISRIDTCIAQIDEMSTTTAKAVAAGSLQLRAAYQLSILRSRARQAAVAMAAALGLKCINRDVFTTSMGEGKADLYA